MYRVNLSRSKSRLPQWLRSAALGAAFGAALGAGFLALGLTMYGLLVLLGREATPITGEDLRQMAAYVGGFALAGALFGGLRPLERGPAAVYVAAAMGGMIVVSAIAIADQGLARMARADWVMVVGLGTLFGFAAARGFLSKS